MPFKNLETEKIMHPKTLFIFILNLLLLTNTSFSQTKTIKGQVILHNSKSKNGRVQFIKDVKLESLSSNTVLSDNKGRFKLELNRKVDINEPLFLKIEKDGYEVVNHRDIKYFFMDNKNWLKIIVAESGYLKKTRSHITATAKQALLEEQKRLLEFLNENDHRAISVFEHKFGRIINSVSEVNELISSLSKKIEAEIRYYSYELAVVNPDDATDFYLNALSYYRQGNFDFAVKELQEENLEDQVEEISKKVKKLKGKKAQINRLIENRSREIEQIKNNYILQIIALQQNFRMREAALALQGFVKINDIAPTRKHREMIEKMDVFPINKSMIIDENKLLEESTLMISKTPNKKLNNTIVNNQPQAESIAGYQPSGYQNKRLIRSSALPQQASVPKTASTTQPKPSFQYQNQPQIKPTIASYEHYDNNKIAARGVTQPTVVNQVANATSTTTTISVTTTITTTPNGQVHVTSQANPTNAQPVQYDQLVMKGQPSAPVNQEVMKDFETIIFPNQQTTTEFKIFLKNETKTVTPTINTSKKYR